MRIFITGGSGHLGQELIRCLSKEHNVYAPLKEKCDILYPIRLDSVIKEFQPDLVIHLAAFVDTFGCEADIPKALDINVLGTINVVQACLQVDCKLVYVSSEYVFRGDKGNYTVEDRLDPINVYGKTKAAAEYVVSVLPKYQIIRAPFIKKVYKDVFVDQFCSRHFLDEVGEKIVHNILHNKSKIVHIATDRASLYEIYQRRGINANPIFVEDTHANIIPHDTSLIDNSI